MDTIQVIVYLVLWAIALSATSVCAQLVLWATHLKI